MMISTVLNRQSKTNYSPMVNMATNTTPHSTAINGGPQQQQQQPHHSTTTTTTTTIPLTRSTIDDFREIVREQSFIIPNGSTSDSNHIDVPIKKYPPLPDIAVPTTASNNNTFFRTEATLTQSKQTQPKKQMFYHFAPSQSSTQASVSQRGHLPALTKRGGIPSMANVMDLDEDLPQGGTNFPHRAATYTSPGDRVISPIKRPSAPSPPASAQVKRPGQNAFVYGDEEQDEQDEEDEENYSGLDDEDSQLFDERFYHHQQPISMINRRIDHYSNNRHLYSNGTRQHTLVLDDGHDDTAHPLDVNEFEP